MSLPMDDMTLSQRRENMRKIRSTDTKPEIVLRKALWKKGYRYRKNLKTLPGKPDIVLTKYRICIFVDSEFFHGKDYLSDYKSKKYKSLKDQLEHSTNPDYWVKKINRNMHRDREVDATLNGLGWKVIRFWSKEVLKNTDECVNIIEEAIFDMNMASSKSTCA